MKASNTVMQVPQGNFSLSRFPVRRRTLLRAWDAADEYVLQHLYERQHSSRYSRVLIANDAFGALTVPLSQLSPQVWSDSWLSQLATRENLTANGRCPDDLRFMSSLEQPKGPLELVLIKAPKTLALLEDQLIRLRPALTPHTEVLVAGMLKMLPRSIWPMLERLIGTPTTSQAWKKAKWISVQLNSDLPPPENPWPACYVLEDTDWRITNHANVFSRESVDIGTRFFLEHLPTNLHVQEIVDLGCGNGLLGLKAAAAYPKATMHFVDESFMAVASARENFERIFGHSRLGQFHVSDALTPFAAKSVDLVLCNPPFHQQNVVDEHLAQRMFQQASKILRAGGELWIVGNRHLGYHSVLKRYFDTVELVASNVKFVVLRSVR